MQNVAVDMCEKYNITYSFIVGWQNATEHEGGNKNIDNDRLINDRALGYWKSENNKNNNNNVRSAWRPISGSKNQIKCR